MNLTTAKSTFSNEKSDTKLFRGKNIARFFLNEQAEEYIKPGNWKDKILENKNNLYIVGQEVTGTTDWRRLHFCKTNKGTNFLFGHTANKILLKNSNNIDFIIAILNSKLLDWYFRKTSTNNHVMGYELEQLPIANPENTSLSRVSYYIQYLKWKNYKEANVVTFYESLADACIYELYFPEEFKQNNCEILKHLTDLPNLSEIKSDKLISIVDIYKKLNDISHPVRVSMFNINTIEEIAIIEGKKI